MSKTLRCLCFGLPLLFLAAGADAADEAVTFRHKMAENETVIYRTKTSMKQSQTVGENKIETTMTQTKIDSWAFDEIDKQGNIHAKTETKQLKVKFEIDPVGEYTFDSTAAERETGSVLSESLNPVFDRLSTARLDVTFSPRGQVLQVRGYKDMFGDLLKDNPLGARFAGGGSDESAKLSMADQFIIFSDKPVQPGDSWEVETETEIPGIGKIKGKRVFNYEGPDKVGELETAKFTVNHEYSIDIDIEANGSEITGSMSTSNASGTVQFDPERGRVVSNNSSYTLAGDISVAVNGMTQTVNTSQTHSVELQLLEKLPE